MGPFVDAVSCRMRSRWARLVAELCILVLLAANIEVYCQRHLQATATALLPMPQFLVDGGLCEPDLVRGWRLRPGAMDGEVNNDGLRTPTLETPRPPHQTRVFCLGGSVTWGWGLPAALTYPRRLENDLRAYCKSAVRVVNGGTPAYSSANCAMQLLELAPRYQCQIVTVMIGFNEPTAVAVRETDTVRRLLEGNAVRNGFVGTLRGWLHHTSTYTLLCGALLTPPPALTPMQHWQAAADNVRLMDEAVARNGGHLLLVYEARRSWASLATMSRTFASMRDPSSERALKAALRHAAAERHIAFLDMEEVFSRSGHSEDELFQSNSSGQPHLLARDPVHPTALGCEIIARAIRDRIVSEGWLER